jgi:hypothetical protein
MPMLSSVFSTLSCKITCPFNKAYIHLERTYLPLDEECHIPDASLRLNSNITMNSYLTFFFCGIVV